MHEYQNGHDSADLHRQMHEEDESNKNELASLSKSNASGLTVSSSDDDSEKQADAIAREVSTGGNSRIGKLAGGSAINTKHSSSPIAPSSEFESQLTNSKGGGQTLDDSTKYDMESKLGVDLNDVRIHIGSQASELSAGINAKAFAHGKDVYFNEGNYNPSSSEGRELLAHELVHTKQGKDQICRKKDDEIKKHHLSDYKDNSANTGKSEYTASEISADLIKETEEYISYTTGKWSKADWTEGEPALTEDNVLLACRLMLREMQDGKTVTFSKDANHYAGLAIRQMKVLAQVESHKEQAIVWAPSDVSDQPMTENKSNKFRDWVLDPLGADKPGALPANLNELMGGIVGDTTFTLNCWELLLYGAVELGIIDKKWLNNLYTYSSRAAADYTSAATYYQTSFESWLKSSFKSAGSYSDVLKSVKDEANSNLKTDKINKYIDSLYKKYKDGKTTEEELKFLMAFDKGRGEVNKRLEGAAKKANVTPLSLMGSGKETVYYDSGKTKVENDALKKNRPLPGDIVFFDGFSHVAMATGLDRNGSPEIVTFWPAPDQEFLEWKQVVKFNSVRTAYGGDADAMEKDKRTIDKVKYSSIDEMLEWGEQSDKEKRDLVGRKAFVDTWAKDAINELYSVAKAKKEKEELDKKEQDRIAEEERWNKLTKGDQKKELKAKEKAKREKEKAEKKLMDAESKLPQVERDRLQKEREDAQKKDADDLIKKKEAETAADMSAAKTRLETAFSLLNYVYLTGMPLSATDQGTLEGVIKDLGAKGSELGSDKIFDLSDITLYFTAVEAVKKLQDAEIKKLEDKGPGKEHFFNVVTFRAGPWMNSTE